MEALQPGDYVFIYGNHETVILCIAMRQRRGLCARLAFADNSGPWVEVGRLKPAGWAQHAWTVGSSDPLV